MKPRSVIKRFHLRNADGVQSPGIGFTPFSSPLLIRHSTSPPSPRRASRIRIAIEPSAEQLLNIGDGLRHSVENGLGAVEVVMPGHGGWQRQAAYSRTVSCLQTMLRVFYREAVRGMQAKPLECQG